MEVEQEFLQAIWGDLSGYAGPANLYGEIRSLERNKPPNQKFTTSISVAMEEARIQCYDLQRDVYFGVLRRVRQSGTAQDCVESTHVLWADFDAKNFNDKKFGYGSAMAELQKMELQPQIVVDSGHGYHAYWLLDQEYEFFFAQQAMQGIEKVHHSDHCSDAARILRVPGTLNRKDAYPLPVRLIKFDLMAPKFALVDFYKYTEAQRWIGPLGERQQSQFDTSVWTPSPEDAPPFGPGERNNGLTRLAGAMVTKGLHHDDVVVALLAENARRCNPPLSNGEVLAIARSVERYRK